jgi:hypothetical protein
MAYMPLQEKSSQLANTSEGTEDHRGFMRLFEPGCPDVLNEVKAKILPEIANHIVEDLDLQCLASFADRDQVQMVSQASSERQLAKLKSGLHCRKITISDASYSNTSSSILNTRQSRSVKRRAVHARTSSTYYTVS